LYLGGSVSQGERLQGHDNMGNVVLALRSIVHFNFT
jgi:hypothetical protein